LCRTDNAIKNHWNSTMRRKFELEEDTRLGLQTTDGAVIGYPVPVPYPDQLPSPVPGFTTLQDQVPTRSGGYWPCFTSRDLPPNVAGHRSSPDIVLPDFSEWLNPGTYPASSPTVSRAQAYPPFDLSMSNSLTFQPSPHAASPLYSLVPNESASIQHQPPPVTLNSLSQEPQMIMPHQVMKKTSQFIILAHSVS